ELTLLPVLVPLAPAATVVSRFPKSLSTVLRSHGIDDALIDHELTEMADHRLAKTENRSVVGIMNEFVFLAGAHRQSDGEVDLLALSLRLAETPCGPLYSSRSGPGRELAGLAAQFPG